MKFINVILLLVLLLVFNTSNANASTLSDVISFWPLNEVSGTRNDSISTNHLTDNNTVSYATGIISNSASFVTANSERLTITDNASLSTISSFTISAWVKISAGGVHQGVVSKWTATGNQREFSLNTESSNSLALDISSSGTTTNGTVSSPALGVGVWYFVIAWFDDDNNTFNIQINNGTINTTTYNSSVYNGTSVFSIGSEGTTSYFTGLIDAVGFWKRVLNSSERTALYSSGYGLELPEPIIAPITEHVQITLDISDTSMISLTTQTIGNAYYTSGVIYLPFFWKSYDAIATMTSFLIFLSVGVSMRKPTAFTLAWMGFLLSGTLSQFSIYWIFIIIMLITLFMMYHFFRQSVME